MKDRTALFAGGLALTAIAGTYALAYGLGDAVISRYLLATQDFPASLLMFGILLLAALSPPFREGADRLALGVARHRFLLAFALWVLLCIGSLFVYRSHPLSMDEYTSWFQSRIFLEGRLSTHFPPELIDWLIPRRFDGDFLIANITTGEVASGYWPGFALVLTFFSLLGTPWACNPTLVALSLILLGRLGRDIFGDERTRGWVILMALASPAFTLNGISYYSMPAHLLLNLAFAWLLLSPSPIRIFLAGLDGSLALTLHNPLPHTLFALPWICWLVFRREHGLRNAGLLAVGYLPLTLLLGVGWMMLVGSIPDGHNTFLTPAPSAAMSGGGGLGEAMNAFSRPFALPDTAVLSLRLAGLVKLWLWSAPPLLVLAWLGARQAMSAPVRLFLISLLVVLTGYFFSPIDQGNGWGYRYAHPAWGALPLLAGNWVRQQTNDSRDGRTVISCVLMAMLLSLVFATALRTWQISEYMGRHLGQLPAIPDKGRVIVFMEDRGLHAVDLVQNDPWLRQRALFMASRGKKADDAMIDRYFPCGEVVTANEFGWVYRLPELPCSGAH